MTGVISHYAMQQFAERNKPPFQFPSTVTAKVQSIQVVANDGVCERCRSIFQLLIDRLDSETELETYPHYDNIVELARSAFEGPPCPLCSLFWEAVMEDLPTPVPAPYDKRGMRIAFTTENMDTHVSPVSKAVVRFSYSGPTDALSNRYFQVDLGHEWTRALPGRRVGEKAPVVLAKEWLRQCASSHKDCPRMKDLELPTRLIHVGSLAAPLKPRLVLPGHNGAPRKGKYLALSHCWGKAKPRIVTETQNLGQYLDEIPLASLSQNFQDAISVTRELGFCYLWIDSLCIVQDSVEDWQQECLRMEAVYSNAAITIAAVGSASSNEGFLGSRTPQNACEVMVQHRDGDPITVRISRTASGQPCVFNQQKAVLDSRAWAMQERLLSPRILSFGTEQMYFECCTAECFESVHLPIKPRLLERVGWLSNPDSLRTSAQDTNSLTVRDFYSRVGTYSHRYLTKASDKLPALGGIARRYQSLTGDTYVAGLWRSDLLQGLLWSGAWHNNHEENKTPRYAYDVEAYKCLPPSWSWAACEMPVKFQHSTCSGSLMAVVRCEAFPISQDDLGQVSCGVLELEAWTIECFADELSYAPHWWGEDLKESFSGQSDTKFARLFRDRPIGVVAPEMTQLPAAIASLQRSIGSAEIDADPAAERIEAMGFTPKDTQRALQVADGDADLAIEYLLNGVPNDDDELDENPPPLPPRPTAHSTGHVQNHSTRLTCVVLSRSFPVSWTPGWEWCGLALTPVPGHDGHTFRRVGLVHASRIYNNYNKLSINPEESMAAIQKGRKRRIRIV